MKANVRNKILVVVNRLFWFTYKNYVVRATEGKSLEAAITAEKSRAAYSAKHSDLYPRVEIERKVITKKDISSGKSYDITEYHVTETHKHSAKDMVIQLGEYIKMPGQENKYIANKPWVELCKNVTDYDPNTVAPVIVIPPHIPKASSKEFWRTVFQMTSYFKTYVVVKDLEKGNENYIMVHNKEIMKVIKNGKPGMILSDNSLGFIWNNITFGNQNQSFTKDLHVDYSLLKNEYYKKLINLSVKVKSTFLLDLVNAYNNKFNPRHDKVVLAKAYEDIFNAIDYTMDYSLKRDIDKYPFKLYVIYYLKTTNQLGDYIYEIYDKDMAETTIKLVKQILKIDLQLEDIYTEPVLAIEDGDYVMTDEGSVQLMDNRTPHDEYMEEEASASSNIPLILGEDYEVQFEDLEIGEI
jgi:hypothetical protein